MVVGNVAQIASAAIRITNNVLGTTIPVSVDFMNYLLLSSPYLRAKVGLGINSIKETINNFRNRSSKKPLTKNSTKQKEEQERKRKLYSQQNKARLGERRNIDSGQMDRSFQNKEDINRQQKNQRKIQEESKEQTKESKAGFGGGKIGAIKKATQKLKSSGASNVASQQASSVLLNTLWSSLFSFFGFFPALLGLNIYFFISIGFLDIIFSGLSKKLAPFGFFDKVMPKGLSKLLGIVILLFSDLLALVILLIIAFFVVMLVTALTQPIEFLKLFWGALSDFVKSLFSK